MDWLLDTTEFMSRSTCGTGWTPFLIDVSRYSNFLIFVAYFAIPANLIYLWHKRKNDLPSPFVFVQFAAFIFACGLTHLSNYFVFRYPAYRLYIIIEVITATLSIATACVLPVVMSQLIKLPSFDQLYRLTFELKRENLLRREEEREYKDHNLKLKAKVQQLENELNHSKWIGRKYTAIQELKQMLEKEKVE